MPQGIDCSGDFALFYVGSDVIGSSSWELLNVSRWVIPGWNLRRTEKGDITLTFSLANPEGKFTYNSSPDFIELKRDLPVVLAVGSNVYFYGIIDKPPVDDTPTGSTATVTCVGRQALTRYVDVTKRYLLGEWQTVEDVIYDIIYVATSLNAFYTIEYTKPEAKDRHPLLRDFVFNNKDAHSCINELVDFHNLRFYMDVSSYGIDSIITSRSQVDNIVPAITTTFSEDNCLDFKKDRGSDIFFNRVKVIARTEGGDVLVAEQQDVQSIVEEGLHVRPVEDIGSVQTQTQAQAYAEYLIAKHSRSNYTTTISVDPTKFVESSLWDLRPLDVISVTHAKLGLGTDEKYVVQEVTIRGDTDQITGFEVVLNHRWRSAQIMNFEETPLIYDTDQVTDDEELVHSRIMSADVVVKGYFNIHEVGTGHTYYPSDQWTNDGFHGLTDHGKQALKYCWLRDPGYGPGGVPSDPYTMRPSTVWPLHRNGSVHARYFDSHNPGVWSDDASAFNTTHAEGSDADGSFHEMTIENHITCDTGFDVWGILVCSRYGGAVKDFREKSVGSQYWYVTVDDPKYLRIGMLMTIRSRNPLWPKHSSTNEWSEYSFNVVDVDYETGIVTGIVWAIPDYFDPSSTVWYADCLPQAYAGLDSAVTFTATEDGVMRWYLRFYNNDETYGANESNLSVVTKKGLSNIGYRYDASIFNEDQADSADGYSYPPPTNLAIGLNETTPPRYEALDTHVSLNDEIARSGGITVTDDFVTSVSESAKVTAKFRSNVVPPKIVRGTIRADTNIGSDAKTVYLLNDDLDTGELPGLEPGDAIFFADSASGGTSEWSFNETNLCANIIKEVLGYDTANGGFIVKLRHDLLEDKKGNGTDGYTKWSTGKLLERDVEDILEFGLFDSPVEEGTINDSGDADTPWLFYLGEQTGPSAYPVTVGTAKGGANSGMGYGDYHHDYLNDEDSLAKESDTPPAYYSDEASEDMDYIIDVTGAGYQTVPIIGMYQGNIPEDISFDEDDNYGRQILLPDVINERMDEVVGPLAAMNLNPDSKTSYIEQRSKARAIKKEYHPSKWRLWKNFRDHEDYRNKSSFWFNDKRVWYSSGHAAQMFVFAVDNDIDREDFKEINLVWRGTGRSYGPSGYKDGVDFFIWHDGDHQPSYQDNEDGTYSVVGRVGDPKTFHGHWEKIEMVGPGNTEHNADIPAGNRFAPLVVQRSRMNGGADNREGINKLGYCLVEGNKLYILAVTKYRAVVEDKKDSRITTDFVGLSVGSSSILSSQEKSFRKGIDFYFDRDWQFIAWPMTDFMWNPDDQDYDNTYGFEELTTILNASAVGDTQLFTKTGSDWFIPGAVVVIQNAAGDQTEIASIKTGTTNVDRYNPRLEYPLSYAWVPGDKVFGFVSNKNEFPIQALGKAISPNFPARAYTSETLLEANGYSCDLKNAIYQDGTQSIVSNTAGFKKDDMVMFYRRPDKSTQKRYGYEWRLLTYDPPTSLALQHEPIIRAKIDDATPTLKCSYDDDNDNDNNDKTDIGICRFPCPALEDGFTLRWLVDEGTWEDGDASGGKWVNRTAKWGLQQYPGIEVIVKESDGTLLTSAHAPADSAGSGYSGWSGVGGPGVKVEYHDEVNGFVWLTKAYDMTLKDWTSANTDSDTKIRETIFSNVVTVDLRTTYDGDLGFYEGNAAGISRGYDAYGNNVHGEGNKSIPVKLARNGVIKLNNGTVNKDNMFCQLSIAESIDDVPSGQEDNNWKLKPKYRAAQVIEDGTGYIKTVIDLDRDEDTKWYLDVPYMDHATIDDYDYRDPVTGKVVFIIDVVHEDNANVTDTFFAGENAGSTQFTMTTGPGSLIKEHDLILIKEGTRQEIVQCTSINGDNVHFVPPLANTYTAAATIAADFWVTDTPSDARMARLVIDATQTYGPIETGDKISAYSTLYRAARYTVTYAREKGNMLVYSLLKDYSVFRPVRSDVADTLQFIQEVKFKYLEKDMV
jgi:hypothetical protein